MVLLDFGTGLRRAELSGLKWQDIDFEEKVLTPCAAS
jgi:integrase